MAQTLVEKYSKRLAVSESVYKRSNSGEALTDIRRVTIATCLDNTSRFLNETLNSASAVQRSDLGDYKRFCLNLTTVTI